MQCRTSRNNVSGYRNQFGSVHCDACSGFVSKCEAKASRRQSCATAISKHRNARTDDPSAHLNAVEDVAAAGNDPDCIERSFPPSQTYFAGKCAGPKAWFARRVIWGNNRARHDSRLPELQAYCGSGVTDELPWIQGRIASPNPMTRVFA